MAANESDNFTHFSNIQVGGDNGGGGIKVGNVVNVTDAATYTVLAKNSGKLHVMPNLTADCTITLPSAERGLSYKFVYGGAAADAQDWIINTAATDELYKGGVVHLDHDAGSGGDEVVPVFADFSNDDTLTVLTPSAGTVINLVSDGTSWYLDGIVVSATAPTLA
jgi:hypothetical protein